MKILHFENYFVLFKFREFGKEPPGVQGDTKNSYTIDQSLHKTSD